MYPAAGFISGIRAIGPLIVALVIIVILVRCVVMAYTGLTRGILFVCVGDINVLWSYHVSGHAILAAHHHAQGVHRVRDACGPGHAGSSPARWSGHKGHCSSCITGGGVGNDVHSYAGLILVILSLTHLLNAVIL